MDKIIGKKFGKLTVIEYARTGSNHTRFFMCRCDCGGAKEVRLSSLNNGHTKSCGCLHKSRMSKTFTKHGLSRTSEYKIWGGIKARCLQADHPSYRLYGGRGITVCDRWLSFDSFIEDMGMRPSRKHSIERIDNELGYTPENCRWATNLEQSRNKRSWASTGVKGVSIAMSGRYKASIGVDGKSVHLGVADTIEEAAKLRKAGEEKYWH